MRVLPVDATNLSTVESMLRLPLSASNEAATRAEELQASLGEGPLDAAELQASVALDLDDLAVRWPLHAAELTAKTLLRAVTVVPLHAFDRSPFATLDLFTTDPKVSDRLDVVELDDHIAAPAAVLLTICLNQVPDVRDPLGVPDWYRTATRRRWNVWVAVGMVMGTRPCCTRAAVSLLRSRVRRRP